MSVLMSVVCFPLCVAVTNGERAVCGVETRVALDIVNCSPNGTIN
jgi:hypothetical protein